MSSHTIEDGYTEKGFIAEQRGLFPATRFDFRPMLSRERDAILKGIDGKPPGKGNQIMAAAMAERIVNWNVTVKGEALEVKPVTVGRLRPRLFDQMWEIISGWATSDVDEELSDEQQNEESEALLEAAIKGQPIGDVKEEAAEKNSDVG